VTALEPAADQYSFNLSAASVPSGPVAITLINQGAQEHQATLVRLKDTEFSAFSQAVAANGAEAALAGGTALSGPNAVAPGQSGEVTALLTPGDYALVCLIPGPPDGKSHAEHGMIAALTAEQPIGATSLPAAPNGTIAMGPNDQMAFAMPPGFNGRGTYAVTNQGTQLHEAAFYKLADGKTQADVVNFFESGGSGAPPVTGAGGVTALAPGGTVTTQLNLVSGSYVVMCFLPDPNNGFTPHFLEGMITTVNIS
jgi:hypothetical protein